MHLHRLPRWRSSAHLVSCSWFVCVCVWGGLFMSVIILHMASRQCSCHSPPHLALASICTCTSAQIRFNLQHHYQLPIKFAAYRDGFQVLRENDQCSTSWEKNCLNIEAAAEKILMSKPLFKLFILSSL